MKASLYHFFLLFGSALVLTGCDKYYISVMRQNIDADYLASARVGTPDPRRDKPPLGEMLLVSWYVPQEIVDQAPIARLSIIFQDYSEKKIDYPVEYKKGFSTFTLLGEDFLKKGGFLTYKAEILVHGEPYRTWKQQLWVKVIHLEDENSSVEEVEAKAVSENAHPAERIKPSVDTQSRQGSVMEIPYFKDELDW